MSFTSSRSAQPDLNYTIATPPETGFKILFSRQKVELPVNFHEECRTSIMPAHFLQKFQSLEVADIPVPVACSTGTMASASSVCVIEIGVKGTQEYSRE